MLYSEMLRSLKIRFEQSMVKTKALALEDGQPFATLIKELAMEARHMRRKLVMLCVMSLDPSKVTCRNSLSSLPPSAISMTLPQDAQTSRRISLQNGLERTPLKFRSSLRASKECQVVR